MLSTKLDFHIPTIEDAEKAVPMLRNSGYWGCDYAFVNVLMWRGFNNTHIAYTDEHLFLRVGKERYTYMFPVSQNRKEAIEMLEQLAAEAGHPLRLYGCDQHCVKALEERYPGRFTFTLSPGDFDYIYNTEDLALLPGKKYHSKRNHISSFSKQYEWQYEPLGPEAIPEVLEVADQWFQQTDPTSRTLQIENRAIHEILGYMDRLEIQGGLIRVDGKVVAFTFGSPLSDQMFDIHVEKALPEYSKAYSVINREFAANALLGKYAYINRENDLGLEGLRRAKNSYHPVVVLQKYLAVEKQ